MKLRYLILLACLFLLTGCNIEYKVNINNDFSISENVHVFGTESLYDTYYRTLKIDVLKENLDRYQESLNDNNYKYELIDEENPYVTLEKKYNDIEDYIKNSQLFNDYFDEIRYNKEGNILKIETIGFNPNEQDNPDRFYVEKLDISITSSYEVINHNAKSVNENTNTFHFEIDEDTKEFKILLEIDTSKRFNPYKKDIIIITMGIIIIIVTWTVYYINNKRSKTKNKK